MPLKNEEDQALKPKDLVFILAIAGRIDAQSRLLAEKLHEDRYIYHLYAILDSLSSSYSMFKYYIDVFLANSNSDTMRDIMTSPEGIAAITGEALFLVTFSFLASYFDKEKNDPVKQFIATAWPYFRTAMKGLKNAYKGWRSTMQVLGVLGGMDLKYLIIPIGLGLGILAAVNRLWLTYMVEKRKKMMTNNANVLFEIQKLTSLTPKEREDYLSKESIQGQSDKERIHGFLAVALGGFIDGLYLYIGVISLAALSSPFFVAMAAISAFYTVSCVISRVYEEYDFQLRLQISQTKCRLELASKEMQIAYVKLLTLQEKTNKSRDDLKNIKLLKEQLGYLINDFEALRQLLKKQSTRTYWTSALMGLKYGLFAYGAMSSVLFLLSSIFALAGTAFPPALLIATVIAGLVVTIGIIAYCLGAHNRHLHKQKDEMDQPYLQLLEMKEHIEADDDAEILSPWDFTSSVKDGLDVKPSPQYFLQEWFEVFRSAASGLSKGNNFANFAGTPLQEADPVGHYHDTPIMNMVTMASALLFSVVLALRALARGFGKPTLGQEPKPEIEIELSSMDEKSSETRKTKAKRESGTPTVKKHPDSLVHFSSRHNFFSRQPTPDLGKSRILFHSQSSNALFDMEAQYTNRGTVEGLR